MKDFRSLEEFASFLARHVGENKPMLEAAVGAMAKNLHKKAHDVFGDLDKLQQLAASTIKQKENNNYSDPEAPLVATGELRDSLEVKHEGDTAGVGTSDMKMVYHEYGTTKAPARPVLQIAIDETTRENQEAFKAGAAEALGISIRRTLI
jgi:phage gpG-like protein